MTMTRDDFDFIRGLVRRRSAITLDDGKEYLAENRLQALARQEGIESVGELMNRLRIDTGHLLQNKVVEAMTTNETSFFRDIHPFETIRNKLIPELMKRRAAVRRLRVWCAASSSGQEPYSLAMLIREHFPELCTWNVEIVASDLSTAMLERARAGRYSQLEVNRGLPATYMIRYFQRDGLEWYINDSIKKMVDFRLINLVQPWPFLPTMDIVIIRNVLIYFDDDFKKQVLAKIAQLLAPNGYLILGGSETPIFTSDLFERSEPEGSGAYALRRRDR